MILVLVQFMLHGVDYPYNYQQLINRNIENSGNGCTITMFNARICSHKFVSTGGPDHWKYKISKPDRISKCPVHHQVAMAVYALYGYVFKFATCTSCEGLTVTSSINHITTLFESVRSRVRMEDNKVNQNNNSSLNQFNISGITVNQIS